MTADGTSPLLADVRELATLADDPKHERYAIGRSMTAIEQARSCLPRVDEALVAADRVAQLARRLARRQSPDARHLLLAAIARYEALCAKEGT